MRPEPSVFEIIESYWYRAPVDVVAIIRDAGIAYEEVMLHPDISGMLEARPNGTYKISVNVRDREVRKRFTAAHELGHYVYHRPLLGPGVDDNRLYRSTPAGKFFNQRIKSRHETQANQFAANLLMPQHLIKELKDEGVTTIEELADRLGVSRPAMRVRSGLPPYPTGAEEFSPV